MSDAHPSHPLFSTTKPRESKANAKKGTLHLSTASQRPALHSALETLTSTLDAKSLYTLSYTQSQGPPTLRTDGSTLTLPSPRTSLAFDDGVLDAVRGAWEVLWGTWGGERGEFMVFEDREGAEEDDEV